MDMHIRTTDLVTVPHYNINTAMQRKKNLHHHVHTHIYIYIYKLTRLYSTAQPSTPCLPTREQGAFKGSSAL